MANELTKEDLTHIVLCLQKTYVTDVWDSDDLAEIKEIAFNAITSLVDLYFGEYNAELITLYAIDSDKNKFESIDELYDYLIDPYSNIVAKDSALTLSQLRKSFPDEEMFKFFNDAINQYKIC